MIFNIWGTWDGRKDLIDCMPIDDWWTWRGRLDLQLSYQSYQVSPYNNWTNQLYGSVLQTQSNTEHSSGFGITAKITFSELHDIQDYKQCSHQSSQIHWNMGQEWKFERTYNDSFFVFLFPRFHISSIPVLMDIFEVENFITLTFCTLTRNNKKIQ